MRVFSKFTLAAGFALALALIFIGCFTGVGIGAGDGSDGKIDEVTIGKQTWMKKNLNIEFPQKSQCYNKDNPDVCKSQISIGKCYDNKPENCKKYGRLYTLKEAKFICPAGWHLPSKGEFETLKEFIKKDKNCVSSMIAPQCEGENLKSKSGWPILEAFGTNLNGIDSYGFTALPGGNGLSMHESNELSFNGIETIGSWWYGSGCIEMLLDLDWKRGYVELYQDRDFLASVRCIKD